MSRVHSTCYCRRILMLFLSGPPRHFYFQKARGNLEKSPVLVSSLWRKEVITKSLDITEGLLSMFGIPTPTPKTHACVQVCTQAKSNFPSEVLQLWNVSPYLALLLTPKLRISLHIFFHILVPPKRCMLLLAYQNWVGSTFFSVQHIKQ